MGSPIVVLRHDENGEQYMYFCGDVKVFVVDERVPHDRVYEVTTQQTPEFIKKLLGSSPIGNKYDARQKPLEARIEAFEKGEKTHLKVVE